MIGMKINQAKAGFFTSEAVMKAVDKQTRSILMRVGGLIKVTAQRSMRPAKQKSLGDMTDKERKTFEIRQREWQKGDRQGKKPRRPLASSKPGEPPRTITKLLRKHTYFVYEPEKNGVVIGPARLNKPGLAPEVLEFGGTAQVGKANPKTIQVKARPFMGPAYEENKAKVAEFYRDSVK